MFKYDIPYPKEGQLTLRVHGVPLNVSKKKAYLIEKMKAHRDLMCDAGYSETDATYDIIGTNKEILYKRTYGGRRARKRQNALL